MGMFDDLIPQQSAPPAAAGGMFDDLIPQGAVPTAPATAPDPLAPPSVETQAASVAEQAAQGGTRGWGEYLWDTANIGMDNAARGAIRGIGGIVDIANNAPRLLNILPGEQGFTRFTDRPFLGQDMLTDVIMDGNKVVTGALQDGLEALGAPEGVLEYDPTLRDPFQRGVARIGEEIGVAAMPMAGLIGRGAQVGVEAARVGGPAAMAALRGGPQVPTTGLSGAAETVRQAFNRNFVAPAAANPVGFAASELGAAAAAGTGATIANELTGNQDRENALIDAGGAIGGVGAYGIANALARAGVDLTAALTGNERYAGRVVRDAVTDELIGASTILGRQVVPGRTGQPIDTQELVDLLARQSDAEQLVPGYVSSTADRAGDTGLGMLEAARSTQGGGGFTARRDANARAVDSALDARAPQENPAEFSAALGLRRDAEIDMMGNTTAGVRGLYDEAVTPLQPRMTASGRGADIRAALAEAKERNAAERVNPAWSPLREADASMDARPLAQAFEEADAQIPEALRDLTPRASAVPQRWTQSREVETGLLDEYGNAIMRQSDDEAVQPLSEIMGVRTALTNDLRREGITPQEERLIEQRLASLDQYVKENLDPSLQQQYEAARAATRDHHDRFSRPNTAIGQTLRDGDGGYRLQDQDVPRKFVQDDQGDLAGMNSLFREAGDNERATKAVRDQILQDARDGGVLDDPARAERFLRDNSQLLSRYPDLAKEFDTVGKLRGALNAAEKAERETIERLTKPGKSAVAKYLSYGDHEAESAIRSIMGGTRAPERIDELLEFVGNDPKAVEGARAAFWKYMDSSSRAKNVRAETSDGMMPIIPRKLAAFLDDPTNRAVAERLYQGKEGKAHLNDLIKLATALKGVGVGPRVANAANPSGTALMMRGQAPVTMAELGSKFYQMQLGRVSPAYLAAHIAGKIASKSVGKQRAKAFENLLDKALTDPEVARELLKENNPANRAALARKVNLWRLNSLSPLLQEDDEDETVRTIMMDPIDMEAQ